MADREFTWSARVPRRLAEKVAAELAEGESVVWAGRPRREMPPGALLWSRMIVFVFLGLVCGVLAVVLDDVARVVCAIVAGLSWLLVLGGLALPSLWRLGVVQERFAYVVTNRRVLICWHTPTRGAGLRSFAPAELTEVTCVEREDGSGDLRFDGDPERPLGYHEGFMNIDGVREVERLVRDTLLPK